MRCFMECHDDKDLWGLYYGKELLLLLLLNRFSCVRLCATP